jgi:hypothetical protein
MQIGVARLSVHWASTRGGPPIPSSGCPFCFGYDFWPLVRYIGGYHVSS